MPEVGRLKSVFIMLNILVLSFLLRTLLYGRSDAILVFLGSGTNGTSRLIIHTLPGDRA